MFMLIRVDDTTSYGYIIAAFVVMGLGMGATMMPVFTAAMASLPGPDVARGSTLMNITQQISVSIGTALFSVLLTNAYNEHSDTVGPTLALQNAGHDAAKRQAVLDQLHLSPSQLDGVLNRGLHYMGTSFGHVFLVAAVLVALCFAPALFLRRKPAAKAADPTAAMMG
jgi:MFS family permease